MFHKETPEIKHSQGDLQRELQGKCIWKDVPKRWYHNPQGEEIGDQNSNGHSIHSDDPSAEKEFLLCHQAQSILNIQYQEQAALPALILLRPIFILLR